MSGSATAYMVNGFDPARLGELSDAEQALIARRAAVLGPSYKLFYNHPAHFVRGQGVYLYDPNDVEYLDVYNNVPSVGHCHPRVVDAVSRQSAILNTHTRYLHEGIVNYSGDLLDTFPGELDRVMYTCTGSEAVDLALRLSRFNTGATGVIVTANAYHGTTSASAELSPSMGPNVPLGRNVYTVPAPDHYRAKLGEDVGETLAKNVEAVIADMERHGIRLAAFLADMIQSTDGVLAEPKGFFRKTAKLVREKGGIFIADEVQPGFGRTGDSMWGFQRHGLIPDIVVMGKPMGNGMPIAGIAVRSELVEDFGKQIRYFNTFGANTVCIAAAQAVLDVIRDEKLMENAGEVGRYMRESMIQAVGGFERVGDVRGAGLFIGLDFVKNRDTKEPDGELGLAVVNRLREKRVLISASGATGNVLKIRPPLPFSKANADVFVERLQETLDELIRQ